MIFIPVPGNKSGAIPATKWKHGATIARIRGGCYAKNVYANKASKYMNIDITRGLKEIDNSLYIVEGEAENNGEAIIEAYQNVNPSVEAVTIKETKHFPHVEAPEQFLEQVGIFF